jgi:ABC-type nickel/cobalt efflux system permease component RcnA
VNWIGGLITATGLIIAVVTWALLDRRANVTTHDRAHEHEHGSAGEGHDYSDTMAPTEPATAGDGHAAHHHH